MRTATVLLAVVVVLVAAPAWADFEAGQEAHDRGNYATTLKKLRPLAEQGDALAQGLLGFMYAQGQGVPQDDARAVRWYRLAAEQGNAMGQDGLGVMYTAGRGVPQDDARAVRWYRLAAEQGNAMGQRNLGFMYVTGRGVQQDYVQAYLWFNLAAAQGDEGARKDRDILAEQMTLAQIGDAQRLAREWKPKSK